MVIGRTRSASRNHGNCVGVYVGIRCRDRQGSETFVLYPSVQDDGLVYTHGGRVGDQPYTEAGLAAKVAIDNGYVAENFGRTVKEDPMSAGEEYRRLIDEYFVVRTGDFPFRKPYSLLLRRLWSWLQFRIHG